jgi:hypothetical protein
LVDTQPSDRVDSALRPHTGCLLSVAISQALQLWRK